MFRSSDLEGHFRLCIYLMLIFLTIDCVTDTLVQLGITPIKIMGQTSHDVFIEFFGIAIGMFRGMVPDPRGLSSVRTIVQSEETSKG